MSTSYSQILKQITSLQAQAEGLKRSEVAAAIAEAKVAIKTFGLTPEDLFGTRTAKPAKAAKSAKAAKGAKSRGATAAEAKYTDGKGGAWVGRGKRPQWLSSALAAGAQLEDFLATKFASAVAAVASDTPEATAAAPVAATPAPAAATPAAAPAKKRARAPKKADPKAE
jgi:DNA-binding protein H-NS